MKGIYTYVPVINYVRGEYSVVNIHGAYIVNLSVESIVLLH